MRAFLSDARSRALSFISNSKGEIMSKAKQHAAYLFAHYKQSGAGLADTLYQRVVKTESLKLWEAKALRDEFKKLIKQGEHND